jgi:hypothetical protein
MAVALLAIGIITFLGGGDASPTPLPTAIARPSTLPSGALPTALPSGSAGAQTPAPPSPSPSGSSDPQANATPSPPIIQVGPGFVTFGTRADNEQRILDPSTSFTSRDRIVWSAHLLETGSVSDVRVLIIKADPIAPAGERLISDEGVQSSASDAQVFVRRIRPQRFLDGPGFYTVRYVRGDRLLSEGYFVLTD